MIEEWFDESKIHHGAKKILFLNVQALITAPHSLHIKKRGAALDSMYFIAIFQAAIHVSRIHSAPFLAISSRLFTIAELSHPVDPHISPSFFDT